MTGDFAPELTVAVDVFKEFNHSVKLEYVICAPQISPAAFITPSRCALFNVAQLAIKKAMAFSTSDLSSGEMMP